MIADNQLEKYSLIRSGRAGFYEQKRGLIAVWGNESLQFLDGLITNDMKTLEDGQQMLAAFPNAQGRLLAVIRMKRQGERFLIETEDATQEVLFQNLFRFTFAGDFFIEDLSDGYTYFELFGPKKDIYHPNVAERWPQSFVYELPYGAGYFVPTDLAPKFRDFLVSDNGCQVIDDELYQILRIEAGIPKFGIDMDETTIVPELGLDGLISYTKGCYIGQEIIARIHFRGHVAKQLTGLVFSSPPYEGWVAGGRGGSLSTDELVTEDGKPAGRITSITYSPKLEKTVALAYVRYEHLGAGTELKADESTITVTDLPFVN